MEIALERALCCRRDLGGGGGEREAGSLAALPRAIFTTLSGFSDPLLRRSSLAVRSRRPWCYATERNIRRHRLNAFPEPAPDWNIMVSTRRNCPH